jgi:hypothetical protein
MWISNSFPFLDDCAMEETEISRRSSVCDVQATIRGAGDRCSCNSPRSLPSAALYCDWIWGIAGLSLTGNYYNVFLGSFLALQGQSLADAQQSIQSRGWSSSVHGRRFASSLHGASAQIGRLFVVLIGNKCGGVYFGNNLIAKQRT